MVDGFAYHGDPDEVTSDQEKVEYTKKIKSLGFYWAGSLEQFYGRNLTMKIKQAYLTLQDGDAKEDYLTLSFPAIFSGDMASIPGRLGLARRLRLNPPVISDLYDVCKQFGQEYADASEAERENLQSAVINLASFDIAEDDKRVMTQAYPILLNNARDFLGCIFWESELELSFNQTIIPESYYRQKYPFIQFRMPQPGPQIDSTTTITNRSAEFDEDCNQPSAEYYEYPAKNQVFETARSTAYDNFYARFTSTEQNQINILSKEDKAWAFESTLENGGVDVTAQGFSHTNLLCGGGGGGGGAPFP